MPLAAEPKRRKSSAPSRARKRTPQGKQAIGGELGAEIGGISLIALAGVCTVSLVRGPEGYIGGALARASVAGLGWGAHVIPALCALTGLLMLWRRTGYMVTIRLLGLGALAIALVIGFELGWSGESIKNAGFSEFVQSFPHDGGGWFGAVGSWALVRLFGCTGSVMVLAAMGAAGLSVATNVPLAVAARWLGRSVWQISALLFHAVRTGYDAMVLHLFEPGAARVPAGQESAPSEAECVRQRGSRRRLVKRDAQEDRISQTHANSEASSTLPQQVSPADAIPAEAASAGAVNGEPRQRRRRTKAGLEEPSGPLEQLKLIDDSALRELPPLALLRVPVRRRSRRDAGDPDALGRMLENTLASFGVEAKVIGVSQGPVVTRFEVQPGPGVKVSKIVNLADDLALAFASAGVRIEAPIPGKAAVGIEVPGNDRGTVYLREVLESNEFQQPSSRLTVALGKDIAGGAVVADLAQMLHLLVAGATGSGKSVCLNSIICSILYKATPDEVRLLMIDPKRVELSVYDGIPHLLAPVVTDPKKASGFLRWVVEEMEGRYKLFQLAGARNIGQYNEMAASGSVEQFMEDSEEGEAQGERPIKPLPYIVVIVDELADMMMVAQNEVEDSIARLAFMARAAGIHLIIATQRPSVDIVTGIIKANIPSRIAFAVSSQVDSRIILDSSGAERLLGKGDMLFHPIGLPKPIRVQGAYISDEEVAALVAHLKNMGIPVYEAESIEAAARSGEGIAEDDELFADAARLIVESGEASISRVQRRFRVGYARAARLIDTMEVLGIVGPSEGSKARKVLVSESELENMLGDRG